MHFLKKFGGIILAGAFIIFVACDELPCPDSDGVTLNASFYSYDGFSLSDTLISNLILHFGLEEQTIYSDTIISRYSDTITSSVSNIQFPLSTIADSSIVIFEFSPIIIDTLVFHYTKTLHLESHECGFVEFFEITSIDATNHQIDSVWVSKKVIEYGNDENIKIYF